MARRRLSRAQKVGRAQQRGRQKKQAHTGFSGLMRRLFSPSLINYTDRRDHRRFR